MSSTVTVRTTNGSLYEGLFHTYQTVGKELNIVLKHAKTLQMEGKPVEERARKPIFLIRGRHLAELKAKEVHLNGQDISAVALRESSQFEDSSVAGKDAQHRELQAFVFDKTPAQGLEEWDAEPTGWTGDDMFKQNADKFGVETTFDMDQYTVALRDDGTGVSAAEAARIEREILASHANDAHTREERGMLDDSGMSEEDRYGAVLRAAPGEAQPQLRVRPQPQQARGTNANAAETPARNKAWPGSSWGRETGRTGGTRGPTEERVDINRMRQTLAEGKKDLKKAVDREKQAQYTNNVSAVDALNLNPGLGSTRFRPDTKPDVAHQLLHYKSKRESAGAPNTLASAAATPVAGVPSPRAAPAAPAAPDSATATAPPATPPSEAPNAGTAPAATTGTALKASADSAKTFKFTFVAKEFVPTKSATATPRSSATTFSAVSSSKEPFARNDRGQGGSGSTNWHAGNRGERGRGHRNRVDRNDWGHRSNPNAAYGLRGSSQHRSGPGQDTNAHPMMSLGTPVHQVQPMISPAQVNMQSTVQQGFLSPGAYSQGGIPGQAAMMPQGFPMTRMVTPAGYIQGPYMPGFPAGLGANFVPAGLQSSLAPGRAAPPGQEGLAGLPGQHYAPNI